MSREAVAVCYTCHHALDEINMLKMKRKRPWRAIRQDKIIDPDVGPIDPQTGLPMGAALFGHQQYYDFCSEHCRNLWISKQ